MRRARVIGEVWATRKAPGLEGRRLKLCQILDRADGRAAGREGARVVVAVDTLAARPRQEVLLAFGSGARNVLAEGPRNRHVLADTAVALLLPDEDGDVPG